MKTKNAVGAENRGRWRNRIHLRKETRQRHILLCLVLWSAISFLVFSRYVMATVIIDGASMEPSLHSGEVYVLNRLGPVLGMVNRGDVVVLRDRGPDDFAIKRVIGMPNDEVEIHDGRVFVNGRVLDEEYLQQGTETQIMIPGQSQFTLGPDSFFVLGDNREESEDSRYYGPIKKGALLGVVIR